MFYWDQGGADPGEKKTGQVSANSHLGKYHLKYIKIYFLDIYKSIFYQKTEPGEKDYDEHGGVHRVINLEF